MTPRRSFPPGMGWIPLTVAVIVAAVVSAVAAVPQFTTKTVGTVAQATTPGAPVGPQASLAPGASPAAGPNGPVTGPGRQTAGPGGPQHTTTTTGGADCSKGQNDGATAPGVTANEIHIATTEVTTGVGAGFLGEAVSGMQAAIQQANNGGGVCGRRIVLDHLNDGWDRTTGGQDISGWINSNNYFALVGEPDSQGLSAAIDSGTIDQAGMPVVGSDGMLADQYFDPWVWPVAAATVTNMHVAVKYAYDHGARSFGIVFDQQYSFGKEGANAFDQEVKRLTGSDIPGYDPSGNGCNQAYCAISPSNNNYSSAINTFNSACKPCGMVMLLLEPGPAESWMTGEKSAGSQWYTKLMGGEPLFDDNLGNHCDTCGGMIVWTGYQPDIQPFDGSKAVYTYHQSLAAVCPSCDPHNEFTEGAYLGTQLFIEACRRVGPDLTRAALQSVLNTGVFDFGLSQPLRFGTATPREANASMAAFSDNFSGSFNGWNYMGTGFIADPARGQDFKSS